MLLSFTRSGFSVLEPKPAVYDSKLQNSIKQIKIILYLSLKYANELLKSKPIFNSTVRIII